MLVVNKSAYVCSWVAMIMWSKWIMVYYKYRKFELNIMMPMKNVSATLQCNDSPKLYCCIASKQK